MEVVHPARQTEILFRIRHVARGILHADDVVDFRQLGNGCRFDGDVCLGAVVVDDNRQIRLGGDFAVVFGHLVLRLTDEHGGQDAQRINAANLLHRLGDFHRAARGDIVRPGVDVHAPVHRILRHRQHFAVEAHIMRIELARRPEGEHAVNPAACQILNQIAIRLLVELAILRDRRYNRHDDAMRLECHKTAPFSNRESSPADAHLAFPSE